MNTKIQAFQVEFNKLKESISALDYSDLLMDRNKPHTLISFIQLANTFSVNWYIEEPDTLVKELWKCLSGMECKVQESLKALEKLM